MIKAERFLNQRFLKMDEDRVLDRRRDKDSSRAAIITRYLQLGFKDVSTNLSLQNIKQNVETFLQSYENNEWIKNSECHVWYSKGDLTEINIDVSFIGYLSNKRFNTVIRTRITPPEPPDVRKVP